MCEMNADLFILRCNGNAIWIDTLDSSYMFDFTFHASIPKAAQKVCDLLNSLKERAETAEFALDEHRRKHHHTTPDPNQEACDFTTRIQQLAKIDLNDILDTIQRVSGHQHTLTTSWFIDVVADRIGVRLNAMEAAVLLGDCPRVVRLSDGAWYVLPGYLKRLAERVELAT